MGMSTPIVLTESFSLVLLDLAISCCMELWQLSLKMLKTMDALQIFYDETKHLAISTGARGRQLFWTHG